MTVDNYNCFEVKGGRLLFLSCYVLIILYVCQRAWRWCEFYLQEEAMERVQGAAVRRRWTRANDLSSVLPPSYEEIVNSAV